MEVENLPEQQLTDAPPPSPSLDESLGRGGAYPVSPLRLSVCCPSVRPLLSLSRPRQEAREAGGGVGEEALPVALGLLAGDAGGHLARPGTPCLDQGPRALQRRPRRLCGERGSTCRRLFWGGGGSRGFKRREEGTKGAGPGPGGGAEGSPRIPGEAERVEGSNRAGGVPGKKQKNK